MDLEVQCVYAYLKRACSLSGGRGGRGRGMHDPPVRELVQATIHIFHRLTSLKKDLTRCSIYWIPSWRSGHFTLSFPGVLPAAGGEYDSYDESKSHITHSQLPFCTSSWQFPGTWKVYRPYP